MPDICITKKKPAVKKKKRVCIINLCSHQVTSAVRQHSVSTLTRQTAASSISASGTSPSITCADAARPGIKTTGHVTGRNGPTAYYQWKASLSTDRLHHRVFKSV